MIVADASAILAILLDEPDARMFESKLARGGSVAISPVNYWEVIIRARSVDGDEGERSAKAFFTDLNIEIATIDAATAQLAVEASARFGKRTPSNLNMGDCFAYALAKSRHAPLLFKGDDFTKTDITPA